MPELALQIEEVIYDALVRNGVRRVDVSELVNLARVDDALCRISPSILYDGVEAKLTGHEDAGRELVTDLYRILLDRQPDQEGLQMHVNDLRDGMPIAELIESFLAVDEFIHKTKKWVLGRISADNMAVGKVAERPDPKQAFPEDFQPPGEAGKSYTVRRNNGFFDKYCKGSLVIDVGYSGYDNPDKRTALPGAIGIDLDYPNYDGVRLPFEDGRVDTVFSSHCLEHILFDKAVIRDWFRVLRVGGFIVCMVPSQLLYEKKRFLPSAHNIDHKRMYTVSSLAHDFENALEANSYRIRHLAENDLNFDYTLGPETHSVGCYEIELVLEKIRPPNWRIA